MLKHAKFLVTIDNGIGHLAATQSTPTFLFYPACLSRTWIVPLNPATVTICQMDPGAIRMVTMYRHILDFIKRLEEGVINDV